ncbi:MAG: hypothetical protein HQL32_12100 [Planctomycetes bacterium]|nr:hypothetical protein [Planctomycetota bacterium]
MSDPGGQSSKYTQFMEITSLKALHASMKAQNIDLQCFEAKSGRAYFNCLFSTREDTYRLSFIAITAPKKHAQISIFPDYGVLPWHFEGFIKEINKDLDYKSPIDTLEFLKQLNESIPTEASRKMSPTAKQILHLRPEQSNSRTRRPYFAGWKKWRDMSKVTERNKLKTLMLLGPRALQDSLAMNASSIWSEVDLGKLWSRE